MKSSARSAPMSRGRRWVPPAPGMMPSVTSGNANRVVGSGNPVVTGERDLQAAAHHGAVHGRHQRNLQRLEAVEQRAVFDLARRTANSPMSAPEKNVEPSHISTTARMSLGRANLLESLPQSGAHFRRDGVDRRIVSDDQRQLTVALDAHTL